MKDGYYLETPAGMLPLAYREGQRRLQNGDAVDVFVFYDRSGLPKATTRCPSVQVDQCAVLEVSKADDEGAYLDWGIRPHLFVPEKEMRMPMRPGTFQVVRVIHDAKNKRIYGTAKFADHFHKPDVKEGDEVHLLVYGQTTLGIRVIVNHLLDGMIFHNEVDRELEIGDRLKGFVGKVREDDKLDIILRKQGAARTFEAQDELLRQLRESQEGFLPFDDHSDPEAIRQRFQMSKKVFKRAAGGLFKNGLIVFENNGMRLKKKPHHIRDRKGPHKKNR
jgi:predicted RNA-binding protein (virulence factor B family)